MRVREKRCGSNPCGGWGAGLLPPSAFSGIDIGRVVAKQRNCFWRNAVPVSPRPLGGTPRVSNRLVRLECNAVDARFVRRYDRFILLAMQAWRDPMQRNAKAIRDRGCGALSLVGKTIPHDSRIRR